MITREISDKVEALWGKFPVLTITGPRQSGKTTLIKSIDFDLPYVSLEDPDIREIATEDPRRFLDNYPKGIILDEVQNVPKLFSYIQGIVDNSDKRYVLSGSQNFQLIESISQSLAGRTAILKLLPLSFSEITTDVEVESFYELIFKGSYPRIYDKNIHPNDYYPSYINTYIERDVRLIKNIDNLGLFTKFIKLCAGRIGQPLNVTNLANDTGVSSNTASSWLAILEASYIIHFVQPYYKNYNKRITKASKLYFVDTGVACSLLGLEYSDQLKTFYMIGNLFENMVVNELVKFRFNIGLPSKIYYWQNRNRKEIDIIVDNINGPIVVEVKSGSTKTTKYFDNIKYWRSVTKDSTQDAYVVYGGDDDLSLGQDHLVSWRNINRIKDIM